MIRQVLPVHNDPTGFVETAGSAHFTHHEQSSGGQATLTAQIGISGHITSSVSPAGCAALLRSE